MLSELAAAEADKSSSDDAISASPVLLQVLRPQIREERTSEERVLAALPAVAVPKERKHGLKTVLLWVAALLLLLLLYFAFVRALDRNRQKQVPSSRPPRARQLRQLRPGPHSPSPRVALLQSLPWLLSFLRT